MKAVAVAFLLTSLMLPACKQAPEPGNPQALRATESRLGIDEVPGAFAAATCSQRQRCCGGHERAARFGDAGGGDMAACEAAVMTAYKAYGQQVSSSHLRGRIAYDGTKLKKCLAKIAEQSCGEARLRAAQGPEQGSDCDTWIAPRVGLGGSCGNDYECMSAYCQGRAAAPKRGLTDGLCAPMPGVGQPCTDECVRGTYCDTQSDAPHCVAAQPKGAQCREDAECLTGVCSIAAGATFGACEEASSACSGAF